MSASLEFRRSNPKRPVNWRWQRAGILAEGGRPVAKNIDDQHIARARRFRVQLNRATTDAHYMRILGADSDLYEAWYLSKDEDDSETKWEIEARLLARQSPDEIAGKVAVTAGTVEIYEACFFHVMDRLELPGYITHSVMGKSVQLGLSQRSYDLLWKMYGYWGGPLVLESLIYTFSRPSVPEHTDQVQDFWMNDVKDTLARKAAQAIRMVAINWQTGMEILNTYLRLCEMEKQAGDSSGGSEAVGAAVDAMMKGLPWSKPLMTSQPNSNDMLAVSPELNQQIAYFDNKGIGLRSNELMLISSGQIPQGFEHMLETAVFPEVTTDE
jgi:hypothetical protein